MVLRSTLLLALVAGAFAVPVNRGGNKCALSTCPSNTKFDLQTGKTYEYDYTTDLVTSMVGSSDQESTLRMKAVVHLEVLEPCEMAIKLTEVDLLDDINGGSSVTDVELLRERLQQHPMRFAWVDGSIERVCQEDDDHVFAVNIKRGILSSIQNSMISFDSPRELDEIDISGKCPVKYERSSNGFRTDVITKTKDMIACVDGHRQNSHFQGLPYHADSHVQSMPLVQSESKCDQEITGNVITRVVCEETHVFRPFSTPNSGATTRVKTELVQKNVRMGVDTRVGPIAVHDYLIFDQTPSREQLDAHFRDAKTTLEMICSSTPEDVRPEVASLFLQLVDQMQLLDATNLNLLNTKAKNKMCNKGLQAFRDALPFIKSKDAILTMRQLIQSGDVDGVEAEFWLTSLAFYPHPTIDMLREAYAMLNLDDAQLSRKAYLGCSSMVNNYCALYDNCREDQIVKDIMKTFEDNLNYNCMSPNHDVIIRSLKSLANTGVADRAIDTIKRCVNNNDKAMPVEFRVEAVKAFRRMPCEVDRSDLMTVFRNHQLDSELRIHAYMQLMKCPNHALIQVIHEQLKTEEINQVGSFVWTHLTNLMESSDPLRQEIGKIILDEELARSFDLDKRKFSRNMEFSVFSEMLNAGATLDSNVIFSEKSALPRSLDLNMTLNLFGQQVNMLETGVRMEGLELLLQEIIGHGEHNHQQQQQRNRADNDISVLDAQYEPNLPERADINMYVRMFGSEIRYEDFHDLDLESFKDKYNLINFIMKLAEEKNYELTKNSVFLAASVIVPTMSGLPLKLTTEGAYSMRVKVHGSMDFLSLLSDPSKLDIHGGVEPSVAVQIQSTMGIDATVAKTGLMMVETLHSSTVMSGKILFEQGKIMSVDWDMPKEKIEILDIKTKFYIHQRGEKQELEMTFDDAIRRESCYDMTEALGVKACYEVFLPISNSDDHPAFPFTGPSSVEVYIKKEDSFEKYHMEATVEHITKPNGLPKLSKASFIIDTPNSRVNRKIEWTGEINYQQMTCEMMFDSPVKRIQINGDVKNEDDLKELSLVMMVDGRDKYSVDAKLPIKKRGNKYEIEPEILIEYPGIPSPRITGTIKYLPVRKIEFDLRIRNVFSETAKAEGEWMMTTNNNKWKNEVALKLSSPVLEAEYKGSFEELAKGYAQSQEIKWTDSDGREQTVSLISKIKNTSNVKMSQYKLESTWTNTLMPRFNGDMALECGLGNRAINIDLNAGLDGKPERLVIKKALSYDMGEIEKMIMGEFVVTIPFSDIDHAYGLTYSQNNDELNFHSTAKMGDWYNGLAEFSGKRESSHPLKLSSNVKLHYPGREIEFENMLQETDRNVYAHTARLQWRPDYVIRAESNIKVADMIDVDMTLHIPEMEPVSVDIQITPSYTNFMLHAKATVDDEDYTVEITRVASGTEVENHSHMNVDIVYPGRHITHTNDYSFNRGVIEGETKTMWDVDADMTQQSTFTYKLHLLKRNPLINMKLEFPDNSVEFNCEANIGNMYELNAAFNSDMTYLDIKGEYLVGMFLKPKDLGAEMGLEMRFNEKVFKTVIDLMLSQAWDEHHLVVDLETPVRGFRTVKLETKHEMTQKMLNVELLGRWQENEMRLVCDNTMKWKQGVYEGMFVFTSPFEGLEDIRIKVDHQANYPVYTTDIEFTLPSSEKVTYRQELTLQRSVKYALDATLMTPWEDYENVKLILDLTMDGAKYVTRNVLRWAPDRQVVVEGELSLISVYEFLIDTKVTTPFRGMETFGLELSNVREGGLWKPRMEVEYMPQQKVTMLGELDLLNMKRMMIRIAAPQIVWFGTIELDYMMQGTLMQHDMTIKLLMDRVSEQPILLVSKTNLMDPSDLTADITLTSPIIVRSMEITFKHKASRRVFNTELTFTVPSYTAKIDNVLRIVALDDMSMTSVITLQEVEYKMTSSIASTQNGVDISCLLNLPYEDFDELGFTVHYTGSPSNFEAHVDVIYGMGRKVQCECKYMAGEASLEIDAKILGIFTKDITLKIDHRGNFFRSMNTNAEFHYGPTSAAQQQQVRRRQRTRDDNTIFGQLIAMMDRELLIKFTHSGNIQTFNSKLEVDLDGQACTFDMTFGLRGREIGGSLRITTPFEDLESFVVEMKHTGTWNDFNNELTWNLNEKPYTITNIFKFIARENRLELSCTLTTPITDYETMSVVWNHEGSLRKFDANGELKVGDAETTLVFTLETGDAIRAELDMTTPIEGMRDMRAVLTHNGGSLTDFTTDLDITCDGKEYDATFTFKWTNKRLNLDTALTLPRRRVYGLTVTHRGEMDDFTSECTIRMPRGPIKATITYKNQGFEAGILVDFRLETPFNIMPEVALKFEHTGLPTSNFESRLETKLPFEVLRDLAVIVKHELGDEMFDNTFTIIYNEKEVMLKTSLKMTEMLIEGKLTLNTPYAGYRRMGVELSHLFINNGFKSMAKLTTPFENFREQSVEFMFKGPLSNLEVTGKVMTSIPGYEMFETSIVCTMNPSLLTLSAKLTTPIRGYEKFELTLTHRGVMSDFEVMAVMQKGNNKRIKAELKHKHVNGIDSMLNIETPWSIFDKFNVVFKVTQRSDGFDVVFDVITPFEDFEEQGFTLTFTSDSDSHKVLTNGRVEWMKKQKFVGLDFLYERNLPKLTCNLKITSALTGYESVLDVAVDYQKLEKGCKWEINVETPLTSPLKIETMYTGELRHFDSSLTLTYAAAVWEMELTFRWEREDKVIDWKLLQSPLEMRNLEIKTTHHHGNSANNGVFRIRYNGVDRCDVDFSYNRVMPLRMRIDIRKPLAFEIECNYNDDGQKKTGDLHIKYLGETFTADMMHETKSGWYTVDEKLVINALLPSGRPLKLDTDVYRGEENMRHKTKVQWKHDAEASWELDLSRQDRRGQDIFEGTLRVEAPAGNAEFTVTKKVMDGKREIEIRGPQNLVVTLVQEYDNRDIRYHHLLDIQHDRLSKNIKHEYLSIIDFDHCKTEFRFTITCEDMDGEVYFRIEDESGNRERIVLDQIVKNNLVNLDNYYRTVYINNDQEFSMITDWKLKSRASAGKKNEYKNIIKLDKTTYDFELEFIRPREMDADIKYVGHVKNNQDGACIYELTRTWKDSQMMLEYGCIPNACHIQFGRKPSRNSPTDLLRLESVYNNANDMFVKVSHVKNGREGDDVILGVEPRNDKGRVKTFVRNNLMKDLGDYMATIDFAAEISGMQQLMSGAVAQLQQSVTDFNDVVEKIFTTVRKMYRREMEFIVESVQQMVRNNEFYLGDIVDFCKMVKDVMARQGQKTLVYIGQLINYFKDRADRMVRGLFLSVNDCFNEMKDKVVRFMTDNWPKVKDLHTLVFNFLEGLDKLVEAIDRHPLVQWYYGVLEKITNGDIARAITAWKAEINEWVREMEQQYATQLAILSDIWNNMKRLPYIRHYERAIVNLYDYFYSTMESYNFEEHLEMIALRLSKITWQAVKDKMLSWVTSAINSWDPDNLALDMDIYYPEAFLWEVQSVPSFDIAEKFNRLWTWMRSLMPEQDWAVSDYYHYYMSIIRTEGILPLAKSRAMLVGTQHYVTFDQRFYAFASECSHLLVRDFVDRLFAVVVNYKRDQGKLMKTITVMDNQHKVEIYPSGKVMKDGRVVELPLSLPEMVVLREKDHVIVKNVHGLGVVYDLKYDTLIVELSVNYFGKTAGLLGTFDNEPKRDLIKADGTIARDIEDFAGSWAVGDCRRTRNIAVVQEPREGSTSYEKCARLFKNDDSPFRRCFKVVDPKMYMNMCVNDLADNNTPEDERLCRTAKAYVTKCDLKKITLKMPEECMTCNKPTQGKFTEEITLEGQQVPKKADVIFVIEHAQCNGPIVENLKDLAEDIKTELATKNVDDVKFGVVGYGGAEMLSKAHAHTIDSKLMNTVNKLATALTNIQETQHAQDTEVDPLKAVYFAAQYPFRTGASKTIVLLPCVPCRNTIYSDVKEILLQRDVRLHVVLEHEYKLKSEYTKKDTPAFESIYGADSQGVFTKKHMRGSSIQSDPALHGYVEMPEDTCSTLAHLSRGTVFDVKQYTEARRNDQKKFMQVMVKVIAESAKPAECLRCQCVSDVKTRSPMSVCQSCSANAFDIYALYPDVLKITDGGILDLYMGSKQ